MTLIKKGQFLILLGLVGCTSFGQARNTHLPYGAWRIGFQAPAYMDVWLETADVEDINGLYFIRAESGTVSLIYQGNPSGWDEDPGWGAGRDVTGAALPKRIYIRWQSLVEPQTYRAILDIPEKARQLMRSKAASIVYPNQYDYQRALSFELAPGGWIKGWVMSATSKPIEVLCQKGEVEPKGPDQGEYGGRYVTLYAKSKEYIANHPVPYESWSCPSD
jgi:hypothetical protein